MQYKFYSAIDLLHSALASFSAGNFADTALPSQSACITHNFQQQGWKARVEKERLGSNFVLKVISQAMGEIMSKKDGIFGIWLYECMLMKVFSCSGIPILCR